MCLCTYNLGKNGLFENFQTSDPRNRVSTEAFSPRAGEFRENGRVVLELAAVIRTQLPQITKRKICCNRNNRHSQQDPKLRSLRIRIKAILDVPRMPILRNNRS